MNQRNLLRRAATLALTAALVLSLLPNNALAAATRDQAVVWAQAQIGKSIDRDGVYGPQCVDLIMAYYEDVFGVPRVGANGGDYAIVAIPGAWQRIQNGIGFIPEPGDIAIWRSTPSAPQYGHVGIVESANGYTLTTIEQVNWGDGQASHVGRLTHTYTNDPYTGTFWGVIRPAYGSAVAPQPAPTVQVSKIEMKTNPTKTSYVQGDTLDTTGMEVLVYQSNNTNRLLKSGFTVSPTKLNTVGTQTITVTYEGKTTTFCVQVSSAASGDTSNYGAWSEWSTTKPQASATVQVQSKTQYRLGRFRCPKGDYDSPIWNIKCPNDGTYIPESSWQERWVDQPSDQMDRRNCISAVHWGVVIDGWDWWFCERSGQPTRTVYSSRSLLTDESLNNSSNGAQEEKADDSLIETGEEPDTVVQVETGVDITLTADMTGSGVKLAWSPCDSKLGYRVYRGSGETGKGTSLTKVPIVGGEYIDVNVRANTQYHYYVCEVLSTSDHGVERLGTPCTGLIVTTGVFSSEATQQNRHYILMQIDNPQMSVDEASLEIDPGRATTPIIRNGRTLVPMRAIVEAMGGSINWDDATQKITIAYGGRTISMAIGSKTMVVDGTSFEMDVAAQTINGRTVLPVRFVGEALGCDIEWLPDLNQVLVVYEK